MPVAWNRVRLELTTAGAQVHPETRNAESLLPTPPNDLGFLFVWSGRGMLTVEEQAITLRPGVVVITRPGGRYAAAPSDANRLGITRIRFDLFDEHGAPVRDDAELPPQVLDVANVPYVDAVTRRVVELTARTAQDSSETELRDVEVAAQLFAALMRDLDEKRNDLCEPPPGTERRHALLASEAASRINESPQDAPSLEELSQLAGYTKDHFARVFKKVVGQTPHDYLINARVRRARQLLVESNLSIKEIASALGYRDIYFFSRQFKAKMGMTPSEARRRGAIR
jgi:AraC-like DNA-binding protein